MSLRIRSRAFTLLEMLVVVGIIAILAAILIPTLSRAKEQGKRVACLANVRTCTMGCIYYIQDYQKYLPYPTTTAPGYTDQRAFWFNAIDPYLTQSSNSNPLVVSGWTRYYDNYKQDPVYQTLPTSLPFTTSTQNFQQYSRTIKYNTNCRRFYITGGSKTYTFASVNDIDAQGVAESNFVLFGDGVAVDLYPAVNSSTSTTDPTSIETAAFSFDTTDRTQGGVGVRHLGFANVGFLDAHAESLKLPTYKRPISLGNGSGNPTTNTPGGGAATDFSSTVFVDAWQSEFVDANGNQVFAATSGNLVVAGLATPSPAYLDNRYPLGDPHNLGIGRNPNMNLVFQIPGIIGR